MSDTPTPSTLEGAIAELRSAVAYEDRMGYGSVLLGACRRVLRAYDDPAREVEGDPLPTVQIWPGGDRRRTAKRYTLVLHTVAHFETVVYWLPQPLQAHDVMETEGVGGQRADLLATIRGTRLRFALGVHCGKCNEFACHLVEVPGAWVGREPHLVRRCSCGDVWRQYPKQANREGRVLAEQGPL